jgi:hypothetical protein
MAISRENCDCEHHDFLFRRTLFPFTLFKQCEMLLQLLSSPLKWLNQRRKLTSLSQENLPYRLETRYRYGGTRNIFQVLMSLCVLMVVTSDTLTDIDYLVCDGNVGN